MVTKKQVEPNSKMTIGDRLCCHVIFFPNGNTAVFKNNIQIPELQLSWFLKFVEFLESKDIDIMNSTYELPEGQAKLTRTEEGYNWNFIGL